MTQTNTTTDRIQKHLVLKAPQSRVWQALTDSAKFGEWFGINCDGPFVPGQPVSGQITFSPYEHVRFTFHIERMEPESDFTYRWHPYAVDMDVDYSAEPTTLVEFHLVPVPEGTALTVVESGFDSLPESRRELAFRMNERGWTSQLESIQEYVER